MKNSDLNYVTKAMVGYIFRNGIVENMHSAGCLTDSQMKELIIYMVDRLGYCQYLITQNRLSDLAALLAFHAETCEHWKDIDFSIGENDLMQAKKFDILRNQLYGVKDE